MSFLFVVCIDVIMISRFSDEEVAARWKRFNSPLKPDGVVPGRPYGIAPQPRRLSLENHPTQGIHGFTDF